MFWQNSTTPKLAETRRGERWGWYGGLGGASIWLLGPTILGFASREWRLGLAGLAALAVNVGLIVYLAPWRHPTVRLWKLYLPFVAFQFVLAAATIHLFESDRPESTRTLYPLAFYLFGPLLLFGWTKWDRSTTKPKPVASVLDDLA